jgi:anti-anti-sigma regulatory factor
MLTTRELEIDMNEPFALPAELTIYSALETRDALLAWVTERTAKSEQPLLVSAQRVSEVDGSGLQLLAAMSSMDLTWRLVDASQVFKDACLTLGLSHWIDPRYLKSEA